VDIYPVLKIFILETFCSTLEVFKWDFILENLSTKSSILKLILEILAIFLKICCPTVMYADTYLALYSYSYVRS